MQRKRVRHLLTAPYSPTTTGKVERFHRTLRAEFFGPNDYKFATIVEAQAALDVWVVEYNTLRPHQSVGDVPPVERFRLARQRLEVTDIDDNIDDDEPGVVAAVRPPGVSRWVDQRGKISVAGFSYRVGPTFAGEPVEVVCQHGLVEIVHAGVVVATHAQRLRPADPRPDGRGPKAGRA